MVESNQDYFPLVPGLILEYRGLEQQEEESGEPTSTSKFEILSVVKKWPTLQIHAECRSSWTQGSDTGSRKFKIVRRENGIYEGYALLLPLPLEIGYSWSGDYLYTVDSFDATTVVPAGEFRNCLLITYLIAGGDAGWGRRYYAPGIGLIREDHSDEASPWSRILTSHNVP